ncbi:hypothetical protein N0V95_001573 [Ascochyta clinopodiicola]|nr:hypothetical protein N0V95_001573 [Ascochyta clinopodiicola]
MERECSDDSLEGAHVAILDSDPNGILDNVKNLSISTIESGLSHLSQQQAKLSLVSLLGALPRDCLSAFTSNDYALSKYELGILLRNQTQIETLESPVTTKKGDPPGPNDIKGKLSLLKTLVVEVFGTEHFAYQGYNHWFAHAPKLRNLRIKGSALSELNHFDAWALPDQTPLLKLLVLTLDNVRLSKSTKSIVDCLYLPDLLHLEIHECDNIEPLLRSFTTAFKKTHRMSLETLEIFDSRSSESLSGVVEEFLGAVTSIRTVKLDFTNGDLIKPESLMGCGQTIETLEIYHYDAEIRYTLHELRKLTSSCPNLTRIGLNLVDLRNTIAALQPFESLCVSTSAYSGPESDEFAKSLQVLAQLPKLLELRLMHRR